MMDLVLEDVPEDLAQRQLLAARGRDDAVEVSFL